MSGTGLSTREYRTGSKIDQIIRRTHWRRIIFFQSRNITLSERNHYRVIFSKDMQLRIAKQLKKRIS